MQNLYLLCTHCLFHGLINIPKILSSNGPLTWNVPEWSFTKHIYYPNNLQHITDKRNPNIKATRYTKDNSKWVPDLYVKDCLSRCTMSMTSVHCCVTREALETNTVAKVIYQVYGHFTQVAKIGREWIMWISGAVGVKADYKRLKFFKSSMVECVFYPISHSGLHKIFLKLVL